MVNKICEDLSDMYLQCIWCQLDTRISRNARCGHFWKFHNTMFLVSFLHTFHTGWCRCRHFGHLSGGKKTLKVMCPTLSIKGKFTRSNLWFLSFELNFTSLTLWIQWKASVRLPHLAGSALPIVHPDSIGGDRLARSSLAARAAHPFKVRLLPLFWKSFSTNEINSQRSAVDIFLLSQSF